KWIGDDESHHFPVPGRRVLPGAHFVHPAKRADRRVVDRRSRQRVQQTERSERGQPRIHVTENVAEGVRTFIAELLRIGQLADAEGVADDGDDTAFVHERPFFFAAVLEAVAVRAERRFVGTARFAASAMVRSAAFIVTSSGNTSTRSLSMTRTYRAPCIATK